MYKVFFPYQKPQQNTTNSSFADPVRRYGAKPVGMSVRGLTEDSIPSAC